MKNRITKLFLTVMQLSVISLIATTFFIQSAQAQDYKIKIHENYENYESYYEDTDQPIIKKLEHSLLPTCCEAWDEYESGAIDAQTLKNTCSNDEGYMASDDVSIEDYCTSFVDTMADTISNIVEKQQNALSTIVRNLK